MSSLRVVVAGFGPIYRAGLCTVLPGTDPTPIAVVGEAGDLDKAVALTSLLRPAVVVSDLGWPTSRPSAIDRLLNASDVTRLVVLADDGPFVARGALEDGASGYVVRPVSRSDLVKAVSTVAGGGTFVDPTLFGVGTRPPGTGSRLSPRESSILELLAFGFTNAEIAARLVISVRTVETHRSNIQHKLGIRTRAELAQAARRAGLSLSGPEALTSSG